MTAIRFTTDELSRICKGTWLTPPPANAIITAIQDDSRQIAPGDCFIAIKGELSDGHDYLPSAVEKGAAVIIVSSTPGETLLAQLGKSTCGCLQVEDTLQAFHALAHAHRMRFPGLLIVGVTGSCGKTSMKEMCAAILEAKYPGHVIKTIGNTNNYFGVPRNLLRITGDTRAAVIEMGSNHPGEILRLATMVCPNIGIISSIGEAHLEFFKDLGGVADEKGDLFSVLPADGMAFYPGNAAHADVLLRHSVGRTCVPFGSGDSCQVQGEYVGQNPQTGLHEMTLTVTAEHHRQIRLEVPFGGQHMAENAAGAAAIGFALGLKDEDIRQALASSVFPSGRMEIVQRGTTRWINDAYNANPLSMRASLRLFRKMAAIDEPIVIILGDMKELGEASDAEHEKLLKEVLGMFPDARLLLVGSEMRKAGCPMNLQCFSDVNAVAQELSENPPPENAWVFVKGSNSIHLQSLFQ